MSTTDVTVREPDLASRQHLQGDGRGYALFGNSDHDVPGLYLELAGISSSAWPSNDLFPQFGIPAF